MVKKESRGNTEKGFEETRLLYLHRVAWEGFLDTMGGNQWSEDLREDSQTSCMGFAVSEGQKKPV